MMTTALLQTREWAGQLPIPDGIHPVWEAGAMRGFVDGLRDGALARGYAVVTAEPPTWRNLGGYVIVDGLPVAAGWRPDLPVAGRMLFASIRILPGTPGDWS